MLLSPATDYSLYGGADLPPAAAQLRAAADLSSSSSSSTPVSTDTEESESIGSSPRAATNELRHRKAAEGAAAEKTPAAVDAHTLVYGLDRTDFLWTMTEEPHRSRRLQILQAHPEVSAIQNLMSRRVSNSQTRAPTLQVTKLMGYEPRTKYIVFAVVLLQITTAVLLRNTHPFSWKFLAAAYAIGGTANQNLFLAIHEITHNLAFKGVMHNRLLAMYANLGIGIPYSVVFKVRLGDCLLRH